MAAQYPGLRRRHQAGGGGANNPLGGGGDANFDGGGGVGGGVGVDGDDINQLQQVQQQRRQQLLRDPAPAGAGNRRQGQRVRRVLDQQQQQWGGGGGQQQQQQQRRRVHPQLRTSHLYCLASALVALLAVVTAPGGGGSGGGGGQNNVKVSTAGLEGHDKGGSSLLMSSSKESGDFGGTGMEDLSSVENVAKAAVAGVAAVTNAKTPTAPPSPPLPSQPSHHHGRQKLHPKQQQQQEDNYHAKANPDAAAMEDDEADFALFYSWSDLKDLLYGVAPTPALGNANGDEVDNNNNKEEQKKQQATSERRDKRTRQSDLQQHAIKHQQRNNAAKEHQQQQQQQGDSDGQTSSGTEGATPAAGPPAFFRFMNPFLISSKSSSHQESSSNDKESSSGDAAAAATSSTNDDQGSSTSSSPAADPNSHYYTHKSIARPFLHFVTNLIDPALRTPNTGSPTDVIDKILTSTPRILAIANLLLAMTYLLHSAVADMFLGHGNGGGAGGAAAAGMAGMAGPTTPGGGGNAAAAGMPPGMGLNNNNNNNPIIMADQDSRTHRRVGRERLGGFLVFKLLLISAVVLPDTLDLLILLSWYTLLAFLRSLAHLAHTTTAHTSQSGQPPRPGVLRLLFVVLLCDFTAAASCVALFHGAGWGMVLLLTCDCALLAVDVLCHIARHVGQALEERHGRRVSEMEDLQLRLHARNRRRQQQEQEQQQQHEEETEENQNSEEEENLVGNEQGADGEGVEIQLVNQATNDLGQVMNPGAVEHNEQTDTHVVVEENVGSTNNENNRNGHGNDDDDEIQLDPLQQHNDNENNEQQEQQPQPQPQPENVETESRSLDRQMEVLETLHSRRLSILDTTVFLLELFAYGLTVCHFLHIWSLHGLQFTLIDGVLALHLHSAVSAAGKKIAERRNLNRIARDLDGFFDDATELEMRKASAAGDVCCICLGTMSAGNVKKVGCGHLYHTHCLREVVERARSIEAAKCPLCRANVVDGTHHPVQPSNNNNNNNNNGAGIRNLGVNVNMDGNGDNNGDNIINNNNNNNEQQGQQQQQQPQQQQQGMNVDGQPQPQQQQQQQQMNQGEHALFRFSTEGILPAWLPLPAFSFEVVRRPPVAVDPPPPAANVNDNNNANNNNANNNGQQPQAQVGDVGNNNGNNNQQQGQGQQGQQGQGDQNGASFWRRLLVLAGAIPMSPEEEARAVDQLVDMFPQYDRADLLRELRDRGSAEAVVEAVLVGAFSGVARGGGGGGGVGVGGAGLAPAMGAMGGNNNNNGLGGVGMMGNAAFAPVEANDGGHHIFAPFEEAAILPDLSGVENIANDVANDNDSNGADAQNVEDVAMMLGTEDIVNGEAAGIGVQRQNDTRATPEDRVHATHGVQDQNTNDGRTASTT